MIFLPNNEISGVKKGANGVKPCSRCRRKSGISCAAMSARPASHFIRAGRGDARTEQRG